MQPNHSHNPFHGILRVTTWLTLCVLIGTLVTPQLSAREPERVPLERVVYGTHGVVVAAEPHAVRIGIEVLQKGGNAVDAAVAVGLAMAVTYPQAGNLGGGGFLIVVMPVKGKTPDIKALDFRETAPKRAHRDMYLDENGHVVPERSLTGYLAVGVPGTVRGLWEVHQRYGSLPWKALVRPAVDLAKRGFAVPSSLYRSLLADRERLLRDPEFRRIFYVNDRPRRFIRQPELARTLERIAKYGADGFYRGPVARALERAMTANGGLIDRHDLAAYRATWREPIAFHVEPYVIATMPPPSAGGWTLAFTFRAMEPHRSPGVAWHSLLHVNLVTEIWKRVYALRSHYLGDPDYVRMPPYLFDVNYQQKVGAAIQPFTVTPAKALGFPATNTVPEGQHTTHYAIIDPAGAAVSVTYTLNSWFGAGVIAPGTGVILNNEMDDFSAAPGVPNQFGAVGSDANAIEPGKRMLSSMTPTIVLRQNRVWGVIGAPGGTRIPTAVYQVLENLMICRMTPDEAVRAPRFHHQWLPDRIDVEAWGIGGELVRALKGLGYRVGSKRAIGRVYLIWREGDGFWGVADPRGPGVAAAVQFSASAPHP